MTKRLMVISVLTTIVIVATLFVVNKEEKQTAPVDSFHLLLPDFANEAEGITRIQVMHDGKQIRVFRDDDDIWRVKEYDNYPAKKSILQKLVQDLAESERLQKKTAKKELLSELGLDDRQATRIRFYGDDIEKPIVDILIGYFSKRQRGTYVRFPNNFQSWLVSGDLTTEPKALHWLKQGLFSIEEQRIKRIKTYRLLDNGEEEEVVISREIPSQGFVLENIPDGQKIINVYQMRMITKSLINMVFSDVMLEKSLIKDKNKRYLRVIAETFDGLVLSMDIHGYGSDWVTIKAKCDRKKSLYSKPDVNIDELENMGILSADVACSQAKAIAKNTKGWVYRLPLYKLSMLSRNYSQITGKKSEAAKKPMTEERKKELLQQRAKSPFNSDAMNKLQKLLGNNVKMKISPSK